MINSYIENKTVVFETGHQDRNGDYRLHQFIIVDSIETGLQIIEKYIEKNFNDKARYNVSIDRNKKLAFISYNEHRTLGEQGWNFIMKITEHIPLSPNKINNLNLI